MANLAALIGHQWFVEGDQAIEPIASGFWGPFALGLAAAAVGAIAYGSFIDPANNEVIPSYQVAPDSAGATLLSRTINSCRRRADRRISSSSSVRTTP
jgi:hypothetical protein